MGCFDKVLIIKGLKFCLFIEAIRVLKNRRRYGAIASPLRCNRVAFTVQWRCVYGAPAPRLHGNGESFLPKSRKRRYQGEQGYPFSALFAPVFKC
ncbi:MAG: hypothetical protein SPG89_05845 [Prevotella sp.]|nr:hypothetical protein [Prevotella sp.]